MYNFKLSQQSDRALSNHHLSRCVAFPLSNSNRKSDPFCSFYNWFLIAVPPVKCLIGTFVTSTKFLLQVKKLLEATLRCQRQSKTGDTCTMAMKICSVPLLSALLQNTSATLIVGDQLWRYQLERSCTWRQQLIRQSAGEVTFNLSKILPFLDCHHDADNKARFRFSFEGAKLLWLFAAIGLRSVPSSLLPYTISFDFIPAGRNRVSVSKFNQDPMSIKTNVKHAC
ncbi:hypothetical protein M514_09091 [Trichuris suis]|uniref:Uncharacterized protein n=1 Tax=Trichuris suis TaxID=68888 RepID=A0A085N5I7_9BILA|nr:hypothetical protein M514_09091 [Trichuris suis]